MGDATTRGLDCSNYDGVLSADLVQEWKDAGIGHVVVRCSLERQSMMDLTRQQLQALQAGGIGASVYVWCYLDDGAPAATAQAAIALVDDLHPRCYWLDVEDDSHQGGPAVNCDWLRRCLAAFDAAGKPCGIYTGLWFWGPYMGNTTEFADRPLWTADYDGVADLHTGHSYGGWTPPFVGKQYQGSGDGRLLGRAADLDIWDSAWLAGRGGDVHDQTDWRAKYDDLNNYWSSCSVDTLKPTVAELHAAAASAKLSRADLQATCERVALRLTPFVGE